MADSIAFIGLGNMGGPMAANLVKAGYRVTGYDLSPQSCEAATANGISVVPSAVEAVKEAGIVVTMLPAGKHVLSVWEELTAAVKPGTLQIDCSTIDVTSAREAHSMAREAGCLPPTGKAP